MAPDKVCNTTAIREAVVWGVTQRGWRVLDLETNTTYIVVKTGSGASTMIEQGSDGTLPAQTGDLAMGGNDITGLLNVLGDADLVLRAASGSVLRLRSGADNTTRLSIPSDGSSVDLTTDISQPRGDEDVLQLVTKSRRVVQVDQVLEGFGDHSHLLAKLSSGTNGRFLTDDILLAGRDLPEIGIDRSSILSHEEDPLLVVDGDNRHRPRVPNDVTPKRFTGWALEVPVVHGNDLTLMHQLVSEMGEW